MVSLDELAAATGESRDRLAEWQARGLLGAIGADSGVPADAALRARFVRLCVDHGIELDAVVAYLQALGRHAPRGGQP